MSKISKIVYFIDDEKKLGRLLLNSKLKQSKQMPNCLKKSKKISYHYQIVNLHIYLQIIYYQTSGNSIFPDFVLLPDVRQ